MGAGGHAARAVHVAAADFRARHDAGDVGAVSVAVSAAAAVAVAREVHACHHLTRQ